MTTHTTPGPRDPALDLTRATLTLLVIAHHAVLAYHLYAPAPGSFTGGDLSWGAFPVVDQSKAPGLDAFTLWNDSFFMAMMFLLSGLFVPGSLERKGTLHFLRDRALRLGLPFLVSAAVLAPLAYMPAYLQRATGSGQPGFWSAWLSLGIWPAGPAWFLWVLLAFSALAALLQLVQRRGFASLSRIADWCLRSPLRSCLLFCAGAALAYVPVTWILSPFGWSAWGPFTVQTCRVPLYALYFLVGCLLGAGHHVLGAWMRPDGPLARHWKTWLALAIVVFISYTILLITVLRAMSQGMPAPYAGFFASLLFAITGVTTTFALLAWFARKERQPGRLSASLVRNAFGMYLVHYVFVNWSQFALLGLALPGLAKAILVTLFAIAASWLLTAMLRRLPGFGRVL